jgi:hypothetical protein
MAAEARQVLGRQGRKSEDAVMRATDAARRAGRNIGR